MFDYMGREESTSASTAGLSRVTLDLGQTALYENLIVGGGIITKPRIYS